MDVPDTDEIHQHHHPDINTYDLHTGAIGLATRIMLVAVNIIYRRASSVNRCGSLY